MGGHAVQHVLIDFRLLVQSLHNLPLHKVLIPQVTLSQHTVQNHRGGSLHLRRGLPQLQRMPIPHLGKDTIEGWGGQLVPTKAYRTSLGTQNAPLVM